MFFRYQLIWVVMVKWDVVAKVVITVQQLLN